MASFNPDVDPAGPLTNVMPGQLIPDKHGIVGFGSKNSIQVKPHAGWRLDNAMSGAQFSGDPSPERSANDRHMRDS